jgi:poly(3-hydroxybutyrate) depolymerase
MAGIPRIRTCIIAVVVGLSSLLLAACGSGTEAVEPTATTQVIHVTPDPTATSESAPTADASTSETSTEPADPSPGVSTSGSEDQEVKNSTSTDHSISRVLQPRRSTHVIEQMVDGVPTRRTYMIHAPSELDPTRKYPVVMAFHGYQQTGDWFAYKFSRLIEAGEFVGIYPNGTESAWNVGERELSTTADDLGFVEEIVKQLGEYEELDLSRLPAVGMSMGALMVHVIAGRTDHLTSAAAVVGQLYVGTEPDRSTGLVSILQISGTADRFAAYEGGESPTGTSYSAEKSTEIWALHNSCDSTPEVTTTESGNRKISYSDCESGVEVVHYGITEGRHLLPDETEGDLWGLIWSFLRDAGSK